MVMLTTPLVATLVYLLPSVLAFDYLVGVGKDENTGKNGLGFDPSSVRPAAGDTVTFEFHAGTHAAIQTTFQTPCTPLSGGFSSGDVTVADDTNVEATGPRQTFNVSSTDPVWFYDGSPGQCGLGGVFSVNPPLTGDQTAGTYLDASEAAGGGSSSSSAAAASSTTATGSSSATSSSTSASGSSVHTSTASGTTTATSAATSSSPSSKPSTNGASIVGGQNTLWSVLGVMSVLMTAVAW